VSKKLSPSLLDGLDTATIPITKQIAIPVITIDDSSPESFTPPTYYPEPEYYQPLSPACFEIQSPSPHDIENADDYITIDEVETSDSEDGEDDITVEKDDDNFAPVEEDIFELELD
jgi:hypothetical protein